jgi:hypothetical protein
MPVDSKQEGFTDLDNRLAAVRAVIIRASLRPREVHVECPVQRRCRTIDRGGVLGAVIDCLMGRHFFAALGLCHRINNGVGLPAKVCIIPI